MEKKLSDNKTKILQELNSKKAVAFVPSGNSMWPFFKNHKSTVVLSADISSLKLFDVILFSRKSGEPVLHRIIDINGDTFTVSGDSQLFTEKVEKKDVHAVMIEFYRGATPVSAFDNKYIKKVKKWYKRKLIRRIKIHFFYLGVKIKKLFSKNK